MMGDMVAELTKRRNRELDLKAELAHASVRHADLVVEAARDGRMTRSEAIEELEWIHGLLNLRATYMLKAAGNLLPVEGTGVMSH